MRSEVMRAVGEILRGALEGCGLCCSLLGQGMWCLLSGAGRIVWPRGDLSYQNFYAYTDVPY